jgi:hypothetical protein
LWQIFRPQNIYRQIILSFHAIALTSFTEGIRKFGYNMIAPKWHLIGSRISGRTDWRVGQGVRVVVFIETALWALDLYQVFDMKRAKTKIDETASRPSEATVQRNADGGYEYHLMSCGPWTI